MKTRVGDYKRWKIFLLCRPQRPGMVSRPRSYGCLTCAASRFCIITPYRLDGVSIGFKKIHAVIVQHIF